MEQQVEPDRITGANNAKPKVNLNYQCLERYWRSVAREYAGLGCTLSLGG
jgi:hypothetical protein